MKTSKLFYWGSLVIGLTFLSLLSCKKDAQDDPEKSGPGSKGFVSNDMVMYWNDKASVVLRTPMTPPSQSRYFAMVQIAVHDALNSIKPKFETYALKGVREKNANPDAAVASAAYWAIKGMNVQGENPIDDWYAQSLATIPDNESKELGKTLGKKAADAIHTNRSGDHFDEANQQLPGPDGVAPGEYRSTLPFSNEGMPKIKGLQQWGTLMTPFVTQSNSQFRPEAPYAPNSIFYKEDYNEVKARGARVGYTRTADEDEMGRFWAADRPSIIWNSFARNVLTSKKIDAWKTARLFALMHTGMVDAISGVFEAKYHYLYWRPETAIRLGDSDGNDQTAGDESWLPSVIDIPNPANPDMNVYTPPIPGYPAGPAAFGGSACVVLSLFLGNDIISVDQTNLSLPGVTRHYFSIAQASRENALARIYAGHYFRNDCLKGEKLGQDIGYYVFKNSFRETGNNE